MCIKMSRQLRAKMIQTRLTVHFLVSKAVPAKEKNKRKENMSFFVDKGEQNKELLRWFWCLNEIRVHDIVSLEWSFSRRPGKRGENAFLFPLPPKKQNAWHTSRQSSVLLYHSSVLLKQLSQLQPGYQNHRHLYSTDHIAQFIDVAVTCNWKTEIPLAFVNSFPSVLVTWLQKAVKARLKIKYIIKDFINLRGIEDSIVVLIYVLKFPLKEKRHQRYKHLLVKWNRLLIFSFWCPWQRQDCSPVVLWARLWPAAEARNAGLWNDWKSIMLRPKTCLRMYGRD